MFVWGYVLNKEKNIEKYRFFRFLSMFRSEINFFDTGINLLWILFLWTTCLFWKGGQAKSHARVTQGERVYKSHPCPWGCCIIFLFSFLLVRWPGFTLVMERATLLIAKLFTRRVALLALFYGIKCGAPTTESQWPSGGTRAYMYILNLSREPRFSQLH